ncbi:helix-hairpin-helix domain-containing protein [Flavobacterium granuli]|uniref:DNA uptake protein ComE-like DNA-binding protein n=1 Tax=Flavobacterium granuli TaxID=280093 RepID=A0ABU1RYM6_9FLAO|nr:helix-hairpin-helix domain-containing protein [Flavobacterium granuli]MDR6843861.1 DNA uptake protein ComE-like DNA-binding protein [Flavobacterium granuli]
MTLKQIKDCFKFSREQRTGIVFLFGIIIILQSVFFFLDFNAIEKEYPDKQKWLSLQSEVDVAKMNDWDDKPKMYPFNPNFISDYKGYKIGMSVQEIDRLLDFRKQNKFVNSAKEFQVVTKVSDSLLNMIAPFFKFPDWVNRKKEFKDYKYDQNSAFSKKEKIALIDINQATKEDLIKINGIGEVISLRILTQKEKLGGFVSMEQLKDVWGLSPEVILNLNTHFQIGKLSNLNKIDINNASIKELSQFFYFKYDLARQIVKYRSMNGDFENIEDLIKINGFPVEKSNFIALYLDF